MSKALPGNSRDADTFERDRHDRIDDSGCVTLRVNGRMHHIGLGRTLARTHIILLVQDLHVRIANATDRRRTRDILMTSDAD
ncbi:MAG: hypothetical protein QOH68_375 [Nocardioidaceae bacterium]|jgi:hypothetical protein|nr:hypothetical protein [Nocardioidaceae bacterium]